MLNGLFPMFSSEARRGPFFEFFPRQLDPPVLLRRLGSQHEWRLGSGEVIVGVYCVI